MSNRSRALRGLAPVLLALAAACSDRQPLVPEGTSPRPEPLASIRCRVTVGTGQLSCGGAVLTESGAQRVISVGGQGEYVKLTSSGTAYDAGTEILSSTVTVQNLLQQMMGTPDGSTVSGMRVFFHTGPTVTDGTGSATVVADSMGTFTAGNQPYYLYNQMLEPYEISSGVVWQFDVDPSVISFEFTVLVYTELTDEDSEDLLDAVWTGEGADSLWTTAGNWEDGLVPDDSSTVAIPSPSDLAPGAHMPALAANVTIANLLVEAGSTLDLATYTLTASGNVDSPGTISGGTLALSGAAALLSGNVSATVVSGGVSLQGATQATGPLSVTGALSIQDRAFSVSVP